MLSTCCQTLVVAPGGVDDGGCGEMMRLQLLPDTETAKYRMLVASASSSRVVGIAEMETILGL